MLNFILLVNKEKNKTSRDMVNELNHIFGMKKIGHTGTLDPIATGILVICGGKYTKLINRLTAMQKEYIATIKVGIKTDTGDITGKIIENKKCFFDKEELYNCINDLIGKYEQTIPAYSAKKYHGKKLYEYARNNEEVPILKNTVDIYSLEVLSVNDEEIKIKCLVSKGTYIRSLIQTICERLNIIGAMSELIRTKQGDFSLDDSYLIDDIKKGNYQFVDLKKILKINTYNLSKEEYDKVINGNNIIINSNEKELLLLYENNIIAIYKKNDKIFKPETMLFIAKD